MGEQREKTERESWVEMGARAGGPGSDCPRCVVSLQAGVDSGDNYSPFNCCIGWVWQKVDSFST